MALVAAVESMNKTGFRVAAFIISEHDLIAPSKDDFFFLLMSQTNQCQLQLCKISIPCQQAARLSASLSGLKKRKILFVDAASAVVKGFCEGREIKGSGCKHSNPQDKEIFLLRVAESLFFFFKSKSSFFFCHRKSNVVVEARQVAMRIFEDYTQSWHWILL